MKFFLKNSAFCWVLFCFHCLFEVFDVGNLLPVYNFPRQQGMDFHRNLPFIQQCAFLKLAI